MCIRDRLYTRRGVSDVVRYTPEKVLEDFGVTPAQIPDLKGLMGDASDKDVYKRQLQRKARCGAAESASSRKAPA